MLNKVSCWVISFRDQRILSSVQIMNETLKLTVLPQAEGKGDNTIFFFSCPWPRFEVALSILNFIFCYQNISLEGVYEYQRDCHQCRKISFLRMCILKKRMPFPVSIECDVRSGLCPISVRDDKDHCICLWFFFPPVYILIYEGSTLKY